MTRGSLSSLCLLGFLCRGTSDPGYFNTGQEFIINSFQSFETKSIYILEFILSADLVVHIVFNSVETATEIVKCSSQDYGDPSILEELVKVLKFYDAFPFQVPQIRIKPREEFKLQLSEFPRNEN